MIVYGNVPKVCVIMPVGYHGISPMGPPTCSSGNRHLGSHEIFVSQEEMAAIQVSVGTIDLWDVA